MHSFSHFFLEHAYTRTRTHKRVKVKVSKIDRDNFLLTNFGREVHSFPDFSIARVNAHTRMRVGEGQKFPKLIVEISYLVTLDEKCTHSPETRYLRQMEKLIINKKVEFRPREHVLLAGENISSMLPRIAA